MTPQEWDRLCSAIAAVLMLPGREGGCLSVIDLIHLRRGNVLLKLARGFSVNPLNL